MNFKKLAEESSFMKIESTIDRINNTRKDIFEEAEIRLELFLEQFNKTFRKGSSGRIWAEVLIYFEFQNVISLFSYGHNSSVFIEIHAILEYKAVGDFPSIISKEIKNQSIIADLVKRKNLFEIAEYYNKKGIWTTEEIKKLNILKDIRNGIAHKNEKLITRTLTSGKKISHLDIINIVDGYESLEYIILALQLYLKLTQFKIDTRKLIIRSDILPRKTK